MLNLKKLTRLLAVSYLLISSILIASDHEMHNSEQPIDPDHPMPILTINQVFNDETANTPNDQIEQSATINDSFKITQTLAYNGLPILHQCENSLGEIQIINPRILTRQINDNLHRYTTLTGEVIAVSPTISQ